MKMFPTISSFFMKKLIGICLFVFAGFYCASAANTILYQQDFGTTNGGNTLAAVGWSQILPPAGYSGMYAQSPATDQSTGLPLPTSTLYFGGNAGTGIFYTTNGAGAGTGGDSAFTSIDPTLYTNLNLSLESQYSYQGANVSSYFAVQVGGAWYVSTNQPFTSGGSAGASFFPSSITYNPASTNWNNLTIGTVVTIGSPASASLSGAITGIGVVEVLTGSGSWDLNNFLITSISNVGINPPVLTASPISQTNYVGAGVSFAVAASGTAPFTYFWKSNGIPIVNGGRISGATTNILNIANISFADASTYSVIVSNSAGYFDTSTNTTATLTVNSVPSDYLYAETFPFVGALAVGYPINVVGWSNSIPDNLSRLFQTTGGDGAVFAFEGSAMTNVFYATTNSDNGLSGLPFKTINPGSYPAVSFSVDIAPTYQPANVTAYFAVQMSGGNWYVNQTPISVDTTTATATYATYAQQFSSLAANWNTLTIGATSGAIGSQASSDLTGNIVGAGLVFIYTGTGGNLNFDNFLVKTDSVAATAPMITSSPYDQTAYVGAGISFAVAATGTRPLVYSWKKDSVTLNDGGRVSGSTSNVITILNVNTNDQGSYVAFVSNGAGSDESDNYFTTQLTVNNPPSGLLYAETFPFVGPGTDSEPVSAVGWANDVPNTPNRLFQQNGDGDGAVFAYQASAATTAFITSSTLDTGTSGLPFPNIDLSLYTNLTYSVDIAPATTSSNVTAFLAVEVNGNWFVAATNLPVNNNADTTVYSTYTQTFNPSVGNWKDLTLTAGSGATIGSIITTNLTGTLGGAGLVFVHIGTGGTFNFDNFLIAGTATGIGKVIVTATSISTLSLTWSGASNVSLQSATNLNSPVIWVDVPNTMGQNSATVSTAGNKQMFFRLIQQ